MRRTGGVIAAVVLLAAGPVSVGVADVRVTNDTDGSYARYDGSRDDTMEACSTGRRTQNEPSVAVDPRNPEGRCRCRCGFAPGADRPLVQPRAAAAARWPPS
jgi:hypothetical protein